MLRKHFHQGFIDANSRKAIDKQELSAMCCNKENIRIFAIIGSTFHGKTTLLERLVARKAISPSIDYFRSESDTETQAKVTKTYKTVTLHHGIPSEEGGTRSEHLIYATDSPGHHDFSSNISKEMRIFDGAVIVIDCIEGVGINVETLLRNCIFHNVKPLVILNKLDMLLFNHDEEKIYQTLQQTIEAVNVIIATYENPGSKSFQVCPQDGSVLFASISEGWGFTIDQFAEKYANKFKISKEKLCEKLWGDHFFSSTSKKWRKQHKNAENERGFSKLVLKAILQLRLAIIDNEDDVYSKMMKSLNIELKLEESKLTGDELIRVVMQKFIPLENSVLNAVVKHVPSPVVSQSLLKSNLYSGPADDESAQGIAKCDARAPLMFCATRFVPWDNYGSLIFGRIFGGTIKKGQTVRIMGEEYKPGNRSALFISTVHDIFIYMGREFVSIDYCPCGNLVAIQCLKGLAGIKISTISTSEDSNLFVSSNRFQVPIISVSVEPKHPQNLPKMIEPLRRIIQLDSAGAQYSVTDIGEHVISGHGELHLEDLLKELKEQIDFDINVSAFIVRYKETITQQSSQVCMAKSPNKHQRIWTRAEPLPMEHAQALEFGDIGTDMSRGNTRRRVEEFDMDVTDARKIWAFGPKECPVNMIVDNTFGIQYLNEIKDSVVTTFNWVASEGVLAGENLFACRFNIIDAVLCSDAIHRGAGQTIPATRRSLYASQLTAEPRMMEPMYIVEINCNESNLGEIYSLLNQRRGLVIEQDEKLENLVVLKGFLPVSESFGFTSQVSQITKRKSLLHCSFDHWSLLKGNPLDPLTPGGEIVAKLRTRKGMAAAVPSLDKFLDKL